VGARGPGEKRGLRKKKSKFRSPAALIPYGYARDRSGGSGHTTKQNMEIALRGGGGEQKEGKETLKKKTVEKRGGKMVRVDRRENRMGVTCDFNVTQQQPGGGGGANVTA